MDAPSEKRRTLIDMYDGHLSKYKQSEILVVKNFLDKLAKFSVCDTEIQQNLRFLLKDIVQRTIEDQKNNKRKEFIHSQIENEEMKKSQMALALWFVRGGLLVFFLTISLAIIGVFTQTLGTIFLV